MHYWDTLYSVDIDYWDTLYTDSFIETPCILIVLLRHPVYCDLDIIVKSQVCLSGDHYCLWPETVIKLCF